MPEEFVLTIGRALDQRRIAVVSNGGHPQIPGREDQTVNVLAVEVVEGWGRRKINDWFKRMCVEKPWETRQ